MIVFKPRLALFYFVALVVISVLTKRLTITSQVAIAEPIAKTNVETSK